MNAYSQNHTAAAQADRRAALPAANGDPHAAGYRHDD